MKKFISMVLVLVMAMFATSGLQCFAKNNFDAKSASVDETIREIEKQIIADNSLDSKAKKELLNNIDALKKKSKSKKHMMSLAWDKVKGTATTVGSATVGGAIVGLFNVKGTAYVPAVLAPFMANEGKGPAFAVAMIAAMGCAFAITMAANVLERKKSEKIPVKKV